MPVSRIPPALSLLLLLLAAAACSGPAPAPDAAVRAGSHAERGDRLLAAMRRLNDLMAQRESAAGRTDELRSRYLQDLMDAAGDVVLAAQGLSREGPSTYLDRPQRNRFYVLADRLYVEAANVEYQAQASDFTDMEDAYGRLDKTCNACHRLFRDED